MEDNICSICGGPNEPWPSGKDGKVYGYGNNAAPVNDGRCCNHCNTTVVIPARLRGMTQVRRARQVTDGQHRENN